MVNLPVGFLTCVVVGVPLEFAPYSTGILAVVRRQHGRSPFRTPDWISRELGRHGIRTCIVDRLRDPFLALGQ